MIELLLQAERALSMGLVDHAERLYRQAVAADPLNSIAVVGLARVALEHADDAEAYRRARQALGIDPENVAAVRLVQRLEEVFAHRGQPLPALLPAAAPWIQARPAPPVVPPTPRVPVPPAAAAVPPPAAAAATPEPAALAPDTHIIQRANMVEAVDIETEIDDTAPVRPTPVTPDTHVTAPRPVAGAVVEAVVPPLEPVTAPAGINTPPGGLPASVRPTWIRRLVDRLLRRRRP